MSKWKKLEIKRDCSRKCPNYCERYRIESGKECDDQYIIPVRDWKGNDKNEYISFAPTDYRFMFHRLVAEQRRRIGFKRSLEAMLSQFLL